jgi:protein subunit release factor A
MSADQRDREESVVIDVSPGRHDSAEACRWADELLTMFSQYAELLGFRSRRHGPRLIVDGVGAFEVFRYEAGTHRVQRVPDEERRGRIWTATADVAVGRLPSTGSSAENSRPLRRIRTYRYGDAMVVDHRLAVPFGDLPEIIAGDLRPITAALRATEA